MKQVLMSVFALVSFCLNAATYYAEDFEKYAVGASGASLMGEPGLHLVVTADFDETWVQESNGTLGESLWRNSPSPNLTSARSLRYNLTRLPQAAANLSPSAPKT